MKKIARRAVWGALVIALCFSVAGPSLAKSPLKRASGEIVDAARLEAIKPILDLEVEKGARAGFVAGVATRDGVVFTAAAGMADRENAIAMTAATRFRIASMTKPIVTAAMMQLVDRGIVALNDPVSLYIPSFADARVATSMEPGKNGAFATRAPSRPITIHDLLTHTAGLGYVFDRATTLDRRYVEANLLLTEGTLGERIDKIARLPLYSDPGKEFRYSYSIDVAAYLIEKATGEPLESWLRKNFFDPLKMTDTAFFVDKTDFERLAVVYEFDNNGKLFRAGENALASGLNDDGFGVLSGGAGLISSVNDYLRFCRMMLNGGELDGARILSPAAVRQMMSDNLQPGAAARLWESNSATFGLGGSVVTSPGRTGTIAAPGEWSWAGYWDTWFVVNPEDGVAVVLLSQTQPGASTPPSRARNLVKAIAYGAVRR